MKAKAKAEELLEKFEGVEYYYQEYAGARYSVDTIGYEAGKKCALIAVDFHIAEFIDVYGDDLIDNIEYWKEVKIEIEKL